MHIVNGRTGVGSGMGFEGLLSLSVQTPTKPSFGERWGPPPCTNPSYPYFTFPLRTSS